MMIHPKNVCMRIDRINIKYVYMYRHYKLINYNNANDPWKQSVTTPNTIKCAIYNLLYDLVPKSV